MMRSAGIVATATAVVLVTVTSCSGCRPVDPTTVSHGPVVEATAQGHTFLQTYVAADGRVRRIDEGDDTVSEAQAYGLLISVAVDDQERFDAIWRWTRANLKRPDGLLAWRWQDGEVVDREPAADADVLAAYALTVASQRFERPDLAREAGVLASAVLKHETITTSTGPVLLSPWAKRRGIVNPSYLAPVVFDGLAEATGEPRWTAAAATARHLLATLIAAPTGLVADWARLRRDGPTLTAAPSPAGQQAQIGLEAWRAPVFLAADCHNHGRQLAALGWPFLRDQDRLTAVYHLDGQPAVTWSHPVALVGAAAAAHAAGDHAASRRLLTAARHLDREHPTYYGSAWLAIGSLLLETDRLGGCATDNAPPSD